MSWEEEYGNPGITQRRLLGKTDVMRYLSDLAPRLVNFDEEGIGVYGTRDSANPDSFVYFDISEETLSYRPRQGVAALLDTAYMLKINEAYRPVSPDSVVRQPACHFSKAELNRLTAALEAECFVDLKWVTTGAPPALLLFPKNEASETKMPTVHNALLKGLSELRDAHEQTGAGGRSSRS